MLALRVGRIPTDLLPRTAIISHVLFLANSKSLSYLKTLLQRKTVRLSTHVRTGVLEEEGPGQSPLTMNSWPSTRVSPLDLCSSVIQWCISSGVSALQCSTRLAVMITNELGLGEKK